MDFSDTCVFSTSMDLSDCQLKTVSRARPVEPEFPLLASSDHHSDEGSDEDPDYEPAFEEDTNAEDRVEFDSDSSQYLTSDDGSSSEYEDFDVAGSRKRKFKRMKMGTQEDDSPKSRKDLNSIWVVQAAEVYCNSWTRARVVEEKIVGSFSLKSDAIENAKVAMSNLWMCENLFDNDGYMADETDEYWSVMKDSSDSVGEEGGVVFKVEQDGGTERYCKHHKSQH